MDRKFSIPLKLLHRTGKAEKISKGNRDQLTFEQHVFPAASIARFASANGLVKIRRHGSTKILDAPPNHEMFCAKRVWDQRSESGFMKEIEDEFQAFAKQIVCGRRSLDVFKSQVATRFFALWSARAWARQNRYVDQVIFGVSGSRLTKFQQDRIEKQHGIYIRENGLMPGRFIQGSAIKSRIDKICSDLRRHHWGVIISNGAEFMCPDTPGPLAALPLTPKISLYLDHSDCVISREEVSKANRFATHFSKEYVFARNFSKCPL